MLRGQLITTDQYLARTELINNGENGSSVEAGDAARTAESINKVFSSSLTLKEIALARRKRIKAYMEENGLIHTTAC